MSYKYHTEDLSKFQFLVTGGAGFIGSHIVAYLLKHNAKKVRVLDNLSTGFKTNLEAFSKSTNFEFIEGDIRDLKTCKTAMQDIDYVSHQAALGSVPRSIDDPATSNAVNVTGFLNMLIALKENTTVRRMVYAASSSTYGDSTILPKVESSIGSPLSPYAVTKYVNELYADVFGKTYNTDTIGLRYFNVFGPKQNPNGAYAAVVPLFMKALIDNVPATINGDGSQTRDFTYVSNAVQGNIKSFFASAEAKNEVFNIACNDRISIIKLWETLGVLSNKPTEVKFGPKRLGDVKDSLADISKAERIIGYKPKYDTVEGLKETWDYFKDNLSEN
ncbi:SDR family oxidoreductase [Lacinutrix sp. MedPE-SW]|uniref:SDR family oxidoreductase n=1 Tax=Lacinutrix sp. MedPE-SW TaxID=1860087 RepID=UPI00091CF971|nr:SDR family oxidoreductase [Lacinutrix sp. MedPE-SW]OIQ22730.1 MAG: LPS biosynthesis protein WbpP [Lacinutrix sp. MedPE-SW]